MKGTTEIMKPIGHQALAERKREGAYYTPKELADFVAREILKVFKGAKKSGKISVLDPASGDGDLLVSLGNELLVQGFSQFTINGFDTDANAATSSKNRLQGRFDGTPIDIRCEDFLDAVLETRVGTLFEGTNVEKCDLLIANPPYVRTQVLGAKKSQKLAKQFGISGRIDLYHAFIFGIAQIMKPGGIVGIIVSNRFMTTKSGKDVRKALLDQFDVLHVWDLGDTQLFEAAVLPAVLLLRKKMEQSEPNKARFTSIYSKNDEQVGVMVNDVISAISHSRGIITIPGGKTYRVRQGTLMYGDTPGEIWRLSNSETTKWLETVQKHTYCAFSKIGKVHVGVKTTADKVFIRDDWKDLGDRPELLKPLITHHIARRYKCLATKSEILYTHHIVDGKRKAVRIEDYPNSKKYLDKHREVLESRKYLEKAGRNWFEIWVPQNPGAWEKPKIVFRDISEKPIFWLDLEKGVVNGDCYWISCEEESKENLLWLALAVGNSSFIEAYYDCQFSNKLYSGRRRFMTQYVEKFPLPNPHSDISKELVRLAQLIFDGIDTGQVSGLENEIDALVWKAFGFNDQRSL